MKRYILLVGALLMLSFSTVCASIPDSEFSLGGITIGSSADYVKSLYGEPDRASNAQPGPDGSYYGYVYGSSLRIEFNADTNAVTGVIVTANNGFSTPAGITVGMDADVITQLYGEPFRISGGIISYHEEGKWLVFTPRNGKITEIKSFDYVVYFLCTK